MLQETGKYWSLAFQELYGCVGQGKPPRAINLRKALYAA
jgi:hypothetical protein